MIGDSSNPGDILPISDPKVLTNWPSRSSLALMIRFYRASYKNLVLSSSSAFLFLLRSKKVKLIYRELLRLVRLHSIFYSFLMTTSIYGLLLSYIL